MPTEATETKPVEDSVAKVGDLAVGSDLDFQRKWWRFSNGIWIFFTCLIVADLLGCFGRGPLAEASARTSDGSMDVKYERIERFSTPSILRIEFGQNAIHEGKVQLWASDTLVKPLGNQRVIPQPLTSVLENAGINYTFQATSTPASVEFAMQPATPGIYTLQLKVPGSPVLPIRIYVMP